MKEIESVNGRWGYLFKILYLPYMNGPRDYHTKGSKSHKVKYHTISLTCGIKKNDTNELIYKTEIDPQT